MNTKNSGKHLEGKIQKVGLRLVWFKGIGSHSGERISICVVWILDKGKKIPKENSKIRLFLSGIEIWNQ